MDEAIRDFGEKALQLVLQGATVRTLQRAISKVVHEYASAHQLPPTPVLYNDCYGGFGLHRHFRSTMNFEGVEDRVAAARAMPAYAERLQTTYPHWFEMAALANNETLQQVLKECRQYVSAKHNIDIARENQHHIEAYVNTVRREEPKDETFLKRNRGDYFWTTPVHSDEYSFRYQNSLAAMKTKLEEAEGVIASLVEKAELGNFPTLSALPSSICAKLVTSMETTPSSPSRKSPFMDMAAKDPHNPDIWACEKVQHRAVMRFLAMFRTDEEVVPWLATFEPSSDPVEVALMCASGRYSRLAIGHVPALCDWTIEEYDGSESVRVL